MNKILMLLLLSNSVNATENLGIMLPDKSQILFNISSAKVVADRVKLDIKFIEPDKSSGTLKFELSGAYCLDTGGILKMFKSDSTIVYLPWDKTTTNNTTLLISTVMCSIMGYSEATIKQ